MQWCRNTVKYVLHCETELYLSPGLCGCTAATQDRPCLQRRLYTSLGAELLSGAVSSPPWGKSADIHLKGTQSLYKWVFVWCRHHTAEPGSHDGASWFMKKEKEVKYYVLVFLIHVTETTQCVTFKVHSHKSSPNLDSFSFAYIMILASSMKSSSDMEPSLIILMATSCWPCHFPYFTTPNWPLPSSLMKVRCVGSISHTPGANKSEWKNTCYFCRLSAKQNTPINISKAQ